jgi:hypothetical protein
LGPWAPGALSCTIVLLTMADTPRAKLKVVRPYDSEEAFVKGDLLRIGRGTIVLADTPPHPAGETVRFDVVLTSGAAVFRGEGVVVAHHGPGDGRAEGLEVKITRFDAKSKAVLDRAQALRAAHKPKAHELPHKAAAPRDVGSLPEAAPARISVVPSAPGASAPGERPSGVRSAPTAHRVPPPPNRDEMLAALRARASRMREAGGLSYKTVKK